MIDNFNRGAFTLIEIMIVVAIIGLLATMALPSLMKARGVTHRNVCINNLRQIDAAKDRYVLECGGTIGSTIALSNIGGYMHDINECFCPAASGPARTFSNTYEISVMGSNPACKIMAPPGYNHYLGFK